MKIQKGCWFTNNDYSDCENKVKYKIKYSNPKYIYVCGKHLHSIIQEFYYNKKEITITKI